MWESEMGNISTGDKMIKPEMLKRNGIPGGQKADPFISTSIHLGNNLGADHEIGPLLSNAMVEVKLTDKLTLMEHTCQ